VDTNIVQKRYQRKEISSINAMSLEYINDIWREYPNQAEQITQVAAPVHSVLQELSPDHVGLFDFPILAAIRGSDEVFWGRTFDSDAQHASTMDMYWRLKALNRSHLLFAREIANYNRKLCELMLGVSPSVAQIFARATIQRCLDLSQSVGALLFALREGRNARFWISVKGCTSAGGQHARLLNEMWRNNAFIGTYSKVEHAPQRVAAV
jgi:hypothetical protein